MNYFKIGILLILFSAILLSGYYLAVFIPNKNAADSVLQRKAREDKEYHAMLLSLCLEKASKPYNATLPVNQRQDKSDCYKQYPQ